jgi:nicotinamide-nucleotide adenylyltransferase
MRAMLLGRFQPFHNGHAQVIRWALDQYPSLILVIGSPQKSYTYANPFTGGERYLMIHKYLEEIGCPNCALVTVPDINRYGVYASHVIDLAPPFDVVLTNDEIIQLLFEKEGIAIKTTPTYNRESLSGTEVRYQMATDGDWHSLVPETVAKIIHDINGVQRVRKLYSVKP